MFFFAMYAYCGYFTFKIIKDVIIDKQKIIDIYKKEYSKSEERLLNPYYALALKQNGYSVPDKYLQPLSVINTSNYSSEAETYQASSECHTSQSTIDERIFQPENDKVKIKIKRKSK